MFSRNKNKQDKQIEQLEQNTANVQTAESTAKKIKMTKSNMAIVDRQAERIIAQLNKEETMQITLLASGKISKEDFDDIIRKKIIALGVKDEVAIDIIMQRVHSELFSYGIIDELINNRNISDIKLYDYNNIRIKKNGKRQKSNVEFKSREEYVQFISRVALRNHINISEQTAIQKFDDIDSSPVAILRVDIVSPLLTSSKLPIMHIRTTPKQKWTREELISRGFFTEEVADLLDEKAVSADGILVSGKGADGKTTAMNYMLDVVPEDKSCYVIQEFFELHSKHPDTAFLHTMEASGEGKVEYTLQDLCKNGLISDIDYFVIGEIKGGEAKYLLNAVYTGAKGWASVHGASELEAITKLADYIKYSTDYKLEDIYRMLVHLNTVVFMKNFKVNAVVEIVGYNEEKKNLEYKYLVKDGQVVKDTQDDERVNDN